MRYILIFFCLLAGYAHSQEKKSIAIVTYKVANLPQWDPESIKKGINGSEEAVIYISKELAALGYQVTVYGDPPQNSVHSSILSNPRYLPLNDPSPKKFDVAIAWRNPYGAPQLKSVAKQVYLWPHDIFRGQVDEKSLSAFDGVLWISTWQREDWAKYNPILGKHERIFGNGIVAAQFKDVTERKNPYSCIYGSNYARGLDILLDIWPEVRKQFPKATLDIYYGWQHWGLLSAEKEARMREQVKELASMGVIDHGSVGHEELNRAYETASFWTYPCTDIEVFCITALRAQMAGAVPVIIDGSALPETVRYGYKCADREAYLSLLLKAMGEAEKISLSDRKKMKDFILEEYTWKKIAHDWDDQFQQQGAFVVTVRQCQ